MKAKHLIVVVCCVYLALPCGPLFAQSVTGTISGRVEDQTGAVLPGATVRIKNIDTGLERTLIADESGRYHAPNLPLGQYEVTGELTGFATEVRSGIRLTVGREAVVILQLKVGEITEKVLVTGEAPMIELTTANTAGLIDESQMRALPLNGRSFIELATLTPGVHVSQFGGRGSSTGFGIKLSVHGSRYTANLFTIDGTQINDQFNQAGSASGSLMGVEAVREFQVLTNSFSAEYGRHTGAVINAATKSGTNEFHGSVFEFIRNDNLDARNFFDRRKPEFKRNQFGVSFGGSLVKDKTFFFSNYEGLRERLGRTRIFTVPSQQLRSSSAVDARVRPFLESYPLPNGRSFDANRGEHVRAATRSTDEDYVVGRVDHNFSSNSTFFGRYTFNKASVTDPSRATTGQISETRFQFVTLEHAYIFSPTLLHRLQLGFTRSGLGVFDYVLPGIKLPQTTFTDIRRGIATMTVRGLSGWGGSSTNPKFHAFNNYQLSDQIAWTRGSHNMKFGGVIEKPEYNLTSDFTSMGDFVFDSVTDFINNRAQRFSGVLPGSDTIRGLRQWVFGPYFQDDVRIRSNFTLNWGVRYEFYSDHSEQHGRLAQLIDFAAPTGSINDAKVVPTLFENPTKRNFAPRIGFAWDPWNDRKTAVRAGFGVFYDLIAINNPIVQNTSVRVPPFFNRAGLVRGSQAPSVNFPDAFFTQTAALAGGAELEGIQPNPNQPYMMKWNLNIQRELFTDTTIEVGYTGTRGVHLVRQIFANGRVAAVNAAGRLQVAANAPLRQPNFGRMRWRITDSTSDYHGMSVSLIRRFARGLSLQSSYTFSRSVDDGASALGGNDFDTETGGSRYLFSKDRGLSPFDVRHYFVTNFNYRLPFGEGLTGAGRLIQGWNLGSLVRLNTGSPLSVFVGFDQSLQVWAPVFPDLKPGANSNPVLGGPDRYFDAGSFLLPSSGVIGNLGRNTLVAPGLANVDLMLGKDTAIMGEKATLQFRSEFFNIFNRVNFGTPARDVFDTRGQVRADAGRITNTTTNSRQIQFGLKLLW